MIVKFVMYIISLLCFIMNVIARRCSSNTIDGILEKLDADKLKKRKTLKQNTGVKQKRLILVDTQHNEIVVV